MKTEESRDNVKDWWDTEAETRLEPGGVLLLQGQRIQATTSTATPSTRRTIDETQKYRHVVYQAHYTDLCNEDGTHGAKPWPEGCLLDPHRLPWRHLETIQHNNPRAFEVMYQQQDGARCQRPHRPGVDHRRHRLRRLTLPPAASTRTGTSSTSPTHLLERDCWSFVTVDPSPTEWWGIIWWLYDPETNNRYIIDLHRKRLNPEQFLSLDLDTFEWSGLMDDIHR